MTTGLAVREVGGDGAERDGQAVEVAPGQQIATQHGGVDQRVGLGLDDRGALQREPPIALLPQDERLKDAERARRERLIGAEQGRERDHAGQRVELATACSHWRTARRPRRPCWCRR